MKSNPTPNSLCAVLLLLFSILNPTISLTEAQTDGRRGIRVSEDTVNAWPRKTYNPV